MLPLSNLWSHHRSALPRTPSLLIPEAGGLRAVVATSSQVKKRAAPVGQVVQDVPVDCDAAEDLDLGQCLEVVGGCARDDADQVGDVGGGGRPPFEFAHEPAARAPDEAGQRIFRSPSR
jgi:hypothetical protein